jgi:hypothetical protein
MVCEVARILPWNNSRCALFLRHEQTEAAVASPMRGHTEQGGSGGGMDGSGSSGGGSGPGGGGY